MCEQCGQHEQITLALFLSMHCHNFFLGPKKVIDNFAVLPHKIPTKFSLLYILEKFVLPVKGTSAIEVLHEGDTGELDIVFLSIPLCKV
ncbi:hypothetical protein BACI349Y_560062 [Bacillus sp. 349Y]|nr:hypothetical protein BACI349Y_560062 [Bacillus sp. 349Y]